MEAERRQVTVLFTDMVGFTSFSEKSGEEAAFTLMRSLSKLMAEAVREQSGVVQGFTGDGITAVFDAPVAFEELRDCRDLQTRVAERWQCRRSGQATDDSVGNSKSRGYGKVSTGGTAHRPVDLKDEASAPLRVTAPTIVTTVGDGRTATEGSRCRSEDEHHRSQPISLAPPRPRNPKRLSLHPHPTFPPECARRWHSTRWTAPRG